MAIKIKTNHVPPGYLLLGKVFPISIYDKILPFSKSVDKDRAVFESAELSSRIESNEITLGEEEKKIMFFLFDEMDLDEIVVHLHSAPTCTVLSIDEAQRIDTQPSMKKPKATAIILQGNSVLLVRSKKSTAFALPGANVRDPRDPAIAAVCRKVSEILEIEPLKATRIKLCDHVSTHYHHRVVLIETDSAPVIMEGLAEFIWWDRSQPIPRFSHVDDILSKYEKHLLGGKILKPSSGSQNEATVR